MRNLMTIMRKDLLRRWRTPLAPIVFLLFPFVFSGLIALAFGTGGGEGKLPQFKMAVVDEDGAFVGGLLRGALNQEQAAQYLEASDMTLPEALAAIEHNRVAGAIVIPKGFTKAVWRGEPAILRVIRNPAQAIGPVAVEETAEFLALLLNGASELLAEPLGRIRAEVAADSSARAGEPFGWPARGSRTWAHDQQVADIAVLMNHTIESAGRFLLPPRIQIKRVSAPVVASPAGGQRAPAAADTAAGSTASSDDSFRAVFQYVLPGMAAFALFILAIGLSADLFVERRHWTLARQLAAPIHVRDLVFGKMSATLVVGLIIAALMGLIGALLLGARADLAAFALLAFAFLLAVIGFVTFLYSFARNEQRGATLASIVLMVMAFLGGSFIPLETMPRFVHSLAPFTLNYWAIEGFHTLLFEHGGIASVAKPLLVLAVVGLVSAWLGSAMLQRQFMKGE